jgi:hypothetical protein
MVSTVNHEDIGGMTKSVFVSLLLLTLFFGFSQAAFAKYSERAKELIGVWSGRCSQGGGGSLYWFGWCRLQYSSKLLQDGKTPAVVQVPVATTVAQEGQVSTDTAKTQTMAQGPTTAPAPQVQRVPSSADKTQTVPQEPVATGVPQDNRVPKISRGDDRAFVCSNALGGRQYSNSAFTNGSGVVLSPCITGRVKMADIIQG